MKRAIFRISVIIVFIAWSLPAPGQNKEEKSAIRAIKTGDIALLKLYLEKHPGSNCDFSNGKTGLYYSILYDAIKISEFLLGRGADPNFKVGDYSTLKWAIKNDRGRIIRFLIEYGAEVNKPDENSETPLIYAAKLDNRAICKILIDRGADPLYADRKEKRASYYASHIDQSHAYKYLESMEERYKYQVSVPSLHDGPYMNWETEDELVVTYYERNQDKNLTRLIEKTMEIGKADTNIGGIGWDKNSYYIKHEYAPNNYKITTAGDIFVIGDIHGKFNALVNLLINNKIIDSELKWIFGSGQLVILGDVFDRGNLVTEALWFLYELEIQAQNSGGNVNLLLGNHEIMELTGDNRYLNGKYLYFTQFFQVYYSQLFEKNTVLGRWLRSQNVILQINEYLFMHAGISPQFAAYDYSWSDINEWVRQYLNSDYIIKKGSPEDIILGAIGPQWYRGYYNGNDSVQGVTQEFVDSYLSSKGLKRMIVGHNEQSRVSSFYEGKIISTDVEIDESGKSAQGLMISGDMIFRCLADGTKEPIE
jgi:hypothetical protein